MRRRSWIAGEKTTDSAPQLQCYNVNTQQRLNMHIFNFSSFKQQQWLTVVSLNCHRSIRARRTILYIHTHVCILSVYTHMHKQSFGWPLHLDSCQISLFLTQECKRGQQVQKISHTVCTTIYIIYITTLRKPAQTLASDRQLQRQAYLEKDKKLFWHFSLQRHRTYQRVDFFMI